MTEYIVTELDYRGRRFIAACLYEDGTLQELRMQAADAASPVGNVYRGTVENVSKNIGGAFVRIKKDVMTFLPVPKGQTVRGASPILVQIVTDASGTKEAVVTENVHLSGQYAVLSRRPGRVSFSKKLTDEQKGIVTSWLKERGDGGFHLLVRTNAARAEKAQFLAEVHALEERMEAILADYERAGSGELLYSPEPFYVTFLRDMYVRPERCKSDVPLYAAQLAEIGKADAAEMQDGQILVERAAGQLSLPVIYGLVHELDKLTGTRVWLKSGAFLVIEKTEAFVSIDVNTGRCTRGRIPEETYRKINLEAAEEIARQLRLRNLSGMILVDFISMKSDDHKSELLHVMRKLVKKDHIHTEAVDITPLGIMEILRQKVRKPLAEELGLC